MKLGLLARDAELCRVLAQLAASDGFELSEGWNGADLVFWQPDIPPPADWKPELSSHVAIVRSEDLGALRAAGKLRGFTVLVQPWAEEDLVEFVRARRLQLTALLELRAERDHLLQKLLGAKAALARLAAERRPPSPEQPRLSPQARAI